LNRETNEDIHFVDTNIVIHNLTADPRLGERAKQYLVKISKGEQKAYSSVHLLTEVYAFLKGIGITDQVIAKRLTQVLAYGIKLLPLTGEIILDVPDYMEKGWKYGDTIHYLTMKQNKITKIVTDDKFYDRQKDIIRVDLTKRTTYRSINSGQINSQC